MSDGLNRGRGGVINMDKLIKSDKPDETGLDFFKASHSGNGGNCVEVARA